MHLNARQKASRMSSCPNKRAHTDIQRVTGHCTQQNCKSLSHKIVIGKEKTYEPSPGVGAE